MITFTREYDPQQFDRKPEHISPEDYLIWLRWFPKQRARVRRMWFDVGLGEGRPSPPGASIAEQFMWLRLTQKRADVIVEYDDAIEIVELREAAQSSAIGRLLMYAELWKKEAQIDKPLRLRLVTNVFDQDVALAAKAAGIEYEVV